MKIVVFNLGCKVNQYESDAITENLRQHGHSVSNDLEKADCYIINTCAVTAEAEKKSRQAVARCRKFNKNARILICGCASQKNPESFIKEGVVYISGVGKKQDIINHINDIETVKAITDLPLKYEPIRLQKPNRTRAYVKIQDGCDNFCSYCIIPYLRGRSRSREIEDIVSEIVALATQTKEIVLIGISLQQYGKDIGCNLTDLIDALKNVRVRIRLGSFYAEGITVGLLSSLQKMYDFCPHFHLSLQSGSDDVLKAMNRHYHTADYYEKTKMIREYFPQAAITTDVIIGYPTETEQNFQQTIDFVNKVKFSDIHIFPFSPRSGTKAANLPPIDKSIVDCRKQRLLATKNELMYSYLINNLGDIHKVLFEEQILDYSVGHSENYLKIYVKGALIGEILKVRVYRLYKDGLEGELV